MSGLISSVGVFLLVDSPLLWVTGLAAALAIGSKYFLRFRGRHIFNPGNFGVLITMMALPDWSNLGGHRWGGNVNLLVLLFFVGTALVIRVNRYRVCFSYLASFVLFNFLRTLYFGKVWWAFSISILGPSAPLFIFYMISDPQTSPSNRKRQLLFGVSLGLVDNMLRQMENPYSPLAALFFVCLAFNLYRGWYPERGAHEVWRTREVSFAV